MTKRKEPRAVGEGLVHRIVGGTECRRILRGHLQ